MRKKMFSIFALLVMILSLTGCIKYNAKMEIKKDKSMRFSIIYAMANSVLELSDDKTILDAEQKESLIKQGFTITDYKDDKNTGVTISKEYPNIDNISSDKDTEFNLTKMFEETIDSKLFKVVKGEKKNTYYANFKFNSSDAEDGQETESKKDDTNVTTGTTDNKNDLSKTTDALTSSFDLKFIVTLPYASINNNATEVSADGKELTWNLTTEGAEYIKFQFELDNTNTGKTNTTDTITTDDKKTNNNSNANDFTVRFFNKANMPVIIGAGVIFLISVIVVIALYVKANKENKKKNNVETKIEPKPPIEVPKEETTVNPVEVAQTDTETPVTTVENTTVEPVATEPQVTAVEPEPVVQATEPVTQTVEPEVAPVEVTPVVTEPEVVSVEPEPVVQAAEPVTPTVEPEVAPVETVVTTESVTTETEDNQNNIQQIIKKT